MKPVTPNVIGFFNCQPRRIMPQGTQKKPFANSHQQMLAARVNWEINQMVLSAHQR